MARGSNRTTDMMMLDSGTSSHMTPHVERVSEKRDCEIPISLADNSTVTAKSKGKRSVTWNGEDGLVKLGLSNTLVSKRLSCSLLSVPALVRKGISVIFTSGKAMMVDVDNNSMLAKFQATPSMRHWKAMKHVCRYLRGTINYGIKYRQNGSKPVLTEWTDADWARDQEKRRSRSGYVLRLSSGPILWCSKMQTSVAMSTTEAEFDALAGTVRDVIWVRAILQDVGVQIRMPTAIFEDNLVSIAWTDSIQGLRNVKHVSIKYQYVREAVKENAVEIRYTPTEKNCADALTKALIGEPFRLHPARLGVVEYV